MSRIEVKLSPAFDALVRQRIAGVAAHAKIRYLAINDGEGDTKIVAHLESGRRFPIRISCELKTSEG